MTSRNAPDTKAGLVRFQGGRSSFFSALASAITRARSPVMDVAVTTITLLDWCRRDWQSSFIRLSLNPTVNRSSPTGEREKATIESSPQPNRTASAAVNSNSSTRLLRPVPTTIGFVRLHSAT
jgi:hypothetical protein